MCVGEVGACQARERGVWSWMGSGRQWREMGNSQAVERGFEGRGLDPMAGRGNTPRASGRVCERGYVCMCE